MKYGITSYGDKAYYPVNSFVSSSLIETAENSKTLRIWKETLSELGFNTDTHGVSPDMLFSFVKDAFENRYNCKIDVKFDRKYIASFNGDSPIMHDKSSRIFSDGAIVYIDELMVSILFEYVANYYLWSRFGDKVFSFCFPYAVNSLNYCCRQGYINSDKNKSRLMKMLRQYGDDVAVSFITDLYWSILAFAFSHELAHVYLGHTRSTGLLEHEKVKEHEYKADAIGYDVYLSIVDGKIGDPASPFHLCFHDYLYSAPIILFLFYEDLYFMEYWVFGEEIRGDHPPFSSRIERLIEISENERFSFDTMAGNDVLNSFWDVSDEFKNQLFLKLKNGKLSHVVQKGKIHMTNNPGYYEALTFDTQMRKNMEDLANHNNVDAKKVIGLYDIVSRIEIKDDTSLKHFVYSSKDSVYSIKPYNVVLRLRAGLIAIVDEGLSLTISENTEETIILLLKMLIKLTMITKITITEDQAKVLKECHENNAYLMPIEEKHLLEVTGVSEKTIDDLCNMKCIELVNGEVWLKEQIYL